MAAPRFIANIAGRVKMIVAIASSAGAGDAEKIPSTNASGVLAPSLLNAAPTGVDKVVMTLGSGLLDPSIMPVGVGADTASIVTSENLAAGNLVNVYNNAGAITARKADATVEGKECHGFVLAGSTSPAAATVYFEGKITGLAGLTPGAYQYMSVTPGGTIEVAPASANNVSQCIGVAILATIISFEPQTPITVA